MKKNLFLAALALVALASCTDSDSIVSDGNQLAGGGPGEQAITFGSYAGAITRADHTGADAAALLGNNFVVEGMKSNGTIAATDAPVFDHYNVNWKTNTAHTTTSNTNDWEYVAQTKHAHATIAAQSIKYWDYSASQYDFIAYSKGTATAVYDAGSYDKDANVLYTKITPSTLGTTAYTVKGKAENLAKVYIADLVTAYRDATPTSDYKNVVNIKFRPLSAKVRIALYETVPGYSVKDVVFYNNATTAANDDKAHLYTTGETDKFNEEGTYTIYYPTTGSANKTATDYNKAHLSFAAETSGTATDKIFDALDLTNTAADKEVAEAAGKVYLGRSSNAATYAGDKDKNYYTIVIPNETGAVLNLKVDYTLVSTDGSGEVINVKKASAQVPKQFATWKSGYAYTYIFKISETNGWTNPSAGPAGLYPITFDAIVVNDEVDNTQETITTVATPSITTYAKGTIVTANDEYLSGNNIYAIVENGTELTVGTNANLYTVTLEDGAAQTINEASVANVRAHGTYNSTEKTYTVTDANGKKMILTESTLLSKVTEVAATDAPNGNAIAVNGAKFTPAAPTCTAVTSGTTLTTGNVYYTSTAGAGRFISKGTEVADGTNYFTKSSTNAAGIYVFEYISRDKATGKFVAGTTYYSSATGDETVVTSGFTEGTTDVSNYYVGDPKKYYKIIKVVD